jgi:type IV pilus assembly protein PilW
MKRGAFQGRKIQGLSLVELMVALTIGLIILAGVSTLFVSSKKTYTTQDRLARLQENARFAMQFLIKDLRLAGYYGCVDEIDSETVHSAINDSGFAYDLSIPIEGLSNVAGSVASPTGTWYPSTDTTVPAKIKLGTDAVAIRMQDPATAVEVREEMPSVSAEIKTDAVTGINANDIIMISDCKSADLFQVTATNTSALTVQHNTGVGTPGNKNPPEGWLSKPYAPPAKVMKFVTRRYYIRDNENGIPALYRDDNLGAPIELVEGIESLKISFGKDTDGDKIPNIYLKAGDAKLDSAEEWSTVNSIRIGILARTVNDKDTDIDNNTYDVDGDGSNEFPAQGDRNKRRVFQSVVVLRNL